jgi:predicted nucleic acid-binding Zn ribbon protein
LPIPLREVYVRPVTYRRDAKPRRRKGQPETAASILAQVVAGLGGADRAQEQNVFSVFDDVVGTHLRKHAQADMLRQGTLYVRVSSSAMAHQVTMLREEILSKMAPHLPPGTITEIRTRVGTIAAR